MVVGMGRLGGHKPESDVNPLRLAAVMYAARKVAQEADDHLGMLRIGMSAKVLGHDLFRSLEILEERLAELRK